MIKFRWLCHGHELRLDSFYSKIALFLESLGVLLTSSKRFLLKNSLAQEKLKEFEYLYQNSIFTCISL